MRIEYKNGFNLSELLVVLFIIGIVAAYTVPMIGLKRVKKPNDFRSTHGIFECYYDSYGNLKQYYIDSKMSTGGTTTLIASAETLKEKRVAYLMAKRAGNKTEKELAQIMQEIPNKCTFDPPKANFFMVYAIGAGGDGYDSRENYLANRPIWDEVIPKAVFDSAPIEEGGDVSTDVNFRSTLGAAPSWVQTNWNKQWESPNAVIPEYTIYSAISAGGNSACIKAVKQQSGCYSCITDGLACLDDCFKPISAWGGDSGKGAMIDSLPIKLLSHYDIKFGTQYDSVTKTAGGTLLRFAGNLAIGLTPPGKGGNGIISGATSVNGSDSTQNSTITGNITNFAPLLSANHLYKLQTPQLLDGTVRLGGKRPNSTATDEMRGCTDAYGSYFGQAGGVGSYEVTPSSIRYSYTVVKPWITGILAGKTAVPNVKVFEKLEESSYQIRPGVREGFDSEERASVMTTTLDNPYELDDEGNEIKIDEEGNAIDPGKTVITMIKGAGGIDQDNDKGAYDPLTSGKVLFSETGVIYVTLNPDENNIPLPESYLKRFRPTQPAITLDQFITQPLAKADIGYIPGKGGSGSYPVLTPTVMGQNTTYTQTRSINNFIVEEKEMDLVKLFDKSPLKDASGTWLCNQSQYDTAANPNQLPTFYSGMNYYQYCKGTKGKNGAVVIVW